MGCNYLPVFKSVGKYLDLYPNNILANSQLIFVCKIGARKRSTQRKSNSGSLYWQTVSVANGPCLQAAHWTATRFTNEQ